MVSFKVRYTFMAQQLAAGLHVSPPHLSNTPLFRRLTGDAKVSISTCKQGFLHWFTPQVISVYLAIGL